MLDVTNESKWVSAFQYGVFREDKLRQADGSRIDWEPSGTTKTREGDLRTLTDEEMDSGILSRVEFQEIGRVIYDKSCLPAWLVDACQVAPISLGLLTRPGLYAAASQSTAPQSNSKPSDTGSATSDKTDPDNGKSEGKSESPTDATAAANPKRVESGQA